MRKRVKHSEQKDLSFPNCTCYQLCEFREVTEPLSLFLHMQNEVNTPFNPIWLLLTVEQHKVLNKIPSNRKKRNKH